MKFSWGSTEKYGQKQGPHGQTLLYSNFGPIPYEFAKFINLFIHPFIHLILTEYQ